MINPISKKPCFGGWWAVKISLPLKGELFAIYTKLCINAVNRVPGEHVRTTENTDMMLVKIKDGFGHEYERLAKDYIQRTLGHIDDNILSKVTVAQATEKDLATACIWAD